MRKCSASHNHASGLLFVLTLWVTCLGAPSLWAATGNLEVRLKSSQEVASVGDIIDLKVEFIQRKTGSLSKLTMPQLKGFIERGRTRSNSSSVRTINGRRTMENIYGFSIKLEAQKPGKFNLGPASAVLNGKKAKSNIVTIRVLGQKTASDEPVTPRADRPNAIADIEEIYRNKRLPRTLLHVEFDKKEAVVGEQITATIRVYSLENLADVSRPEFPKLKNFLSESLETPKRIIPRDAVLKSQNYQVYLIERLALFPLETGEQVLNRITLETNTSGGFFRRGKKIKLQSQPYNLKILPLPQQGQPRNFSIHNVGQWKMSAEVDRRHTKLNEPISLKLIATGQGSARQLKLPDIQTHSDYRAFPPTFSEKTSASGNKIIGMKTAEILIQPQKKGLITLGPFILHYYDPQKKQYQRSQTRPIRVRVNEGIVGSGKMLAKDKKETLLRPVKMNLKLTKKYPLLIEPKNMWFIFIGGWLLFFAFALMVMLRKQNQGSLAYAQQQAAHLRKQRFNELHQARDLAGVMELLNEHASHCFGERVKSITQRDLPDYLQEQGCPTEFATQFAQWLDEAHAQRYAPMGAQTSEALFDTALHIYQGFATASKDETESRP